MFVGRVGSKLRAFIAIGCALTIVAGCGSGTASPPNSAQASASPSVSKQAGVAGLETRLTVINASGETRPVKVCNSVDTSDSTNCPYFHGNLFDGEEVAGQQGQPGIFAEIHYADGSITYAEANNPLIGEPYITLGTSPGGMGESSGKVELDAGEIKYSVQIRDHYYQLERRGDTSYYKEMRLIIK